MSRRILAGTVEGPLRESPLGTAIADRVLHLRVHDIRDSTTDEHRHVGDEPGGGWSRRTRSRPGLAGT